MKPRHLCGAIAVWCVVYFAFVASLCAQEAIVPKRIGVPQDWSQNHIVFSRDALARHPDLINREPRIRQQAMQRWQAPDWGSFHGVEPLPTPQEEGGLYRDWNAALALGRLSPHKFPAKFSLDPTAPPDCVNDYVVFGLNVVGVAGGQANLVAFNNLYVNSTGGGFCSGSAPIVMFAYDVSTAGGTISTSPVLSEDGSQIAFVEGVSGTTPCSIFHVLTWAPGGGAITNAAVPAPGTMTSLPLSPSGSCPSAANDTTSSPWIDYDSDTAYVGDNDGNVYQITNAFTPSPTLSPSPWPIQVSPGSHLTPPVLDSNLGMLMVGSNRRLYQINVNFPATPPASLQVGYPGGLTSGIFAPPIVDITNGTTFVVDANGAIIPDAGCPCAILAEVDTATLNDLQTVDIGLGSSGGTALHLYEPAFSNDYYNDPSTGVITLCGTSPSDTSPWQYTFGFTVPGPGPQPIMNFTGSSTQLSTDTTDRCTGWTEFYNPSINSGVDFFFFGLTNDCTGVGGTSDTGCVVALSSDPSIPTTTAAVQGGPSGIVVDNYSNAVAASSIYFVAAGAPTAYKFTQNGLQ